MANLPAALPRPTTLAAREDAKQRAVTGKVKAAVEAMVWQGLQRRDAAQAAGLAEHSLYQALRRPPVRAYYLSLLDVLRTSERARNIHALVEVRDQQTNQMARVGAVKALEQLEDDAHQRLGTVAHALPGLVIVVQAASATRPANVGTSMGTIEATANKPMISEDSGG